MKILTHPGSTVSRFDAESAECEPLLCGYCPDVILACIHEGIEESFHYLVISRRAKMLLLKRGEDGPE